MLGQTGEPFFAADYVGSPHQMIIHRVGEMVRRNAVRLQKHKILIVFGDLHIPLNQIREFDFFILRTVRKNTHNKRVSRLQMLLHFLDGEVSAGQHLGTACFRFRLPVGIFEFFLFVDLGKLVQLLLRGEAGIRFSLTYKLFCEGLIDFRTLGLTVRTVCALIGNSAAAVQNSTFIKMNAVRGKGTNQSFRRTFYLALGIGILNTKIEHTAALVGKPLANRGGKQSAEVNVSRGAGCKTGHLRALGQLTCRIPCLQLLRSGSYMRKQ